MMNVRFPQMEFDEIRCVYITRRVFNIGGYFLTLARCETVEGVLAKLQALKMDERSHVPRGEAVKIFGNDLQLTESKERVTWIPQSLVTVFPIEFM